MRGKDRNYTLNAIPGSWGGLGHIIRLWRDPLGFLESLPKHGDLVRLQLGTVRVWMLCDPELTHHVLQDGRTFDKGGTFDEATRLIVQDGLVVAPHEPHKRQRRLVQPVFHHERLNQYATLMDTEIRAVSDSWPAERILDGVGEMQRLAMRVTARTMFSSALGEHTVGQVREDLTNIMDGARHKLFARMSGLGWVPTATGRRFDASIARMNRTVTDLIADYRRSGRDHGDMLSMLLESTDEHGDALTDEEVHAQVLTVFMAGTETTASLLAWALHLVSLDEDLQDRIREEARELPDEGVGLADVGKLKLTRRVLTETLRMYPPVWIFHRRLRTQSKLLDTRLPEGSNLFYSPYVIHHRPDLYPEPHVFRPDRWLPGAADHLPKGGYVPFGGGSRKCIGDEFAHTESAIALARILGAWRLRPEPGVVVRPAVKASLRPDAVPLRLSRHVRQET
ncbi:cytochrome P450 [Streptomyces sp. NPDC101062]|uniref:cytochrome P450 n=1 Tax=unclassified Streptomyces TaxID=2593676 RepID=UPI00381F1ABF